MKHIFLVIWFSLVHATMVAQETRLSLSENELIQIVLKYHPVARQAALNVSLSEAGVLKARGGFDPILQLGATKKELTDITYYNYNQADIKIPTWYGLELGAGFEEVTGLRTDPQETQGYSSYAGISASLLKNLVLDKRRATLKQAQVLVKQTETERQSILNDLIYEALTSYWQWALAYQKLAILKQAVTVNRQRVDFTKSIIGLGERPAIDSIEAITQLQYFLALQNEATLEVRNSLIQLSTYTWNENSIPYDLPMSLEPVDMPLQKNTISYDLITETEYIESMLTNHPEISVYKYKFDFLEINRKVKLQEMLPTLNAKYNFLQKGSSFPITQGTTFLQNNYQYGLAFYMPLRLSEGRAEYKMANIKIKQTKYAFEFKRLSMINKVKEYHATLKMLEQQIELQRDLLKNQEQLLSGEEIRFNNGESSLFMINSREQKRIETEQKLAETIAKYYKQKAAMKWVTGMLTN